MTDVDQFMLAWTTGASTLTLLVMIYFVFRS